jgi:amino acid permease
MANINDVHETFSPSESYILKQRLFTFVDEWLFYGLLFWLILNGYTGLAITTGIIGFLMIATSYQRLWGYEEIRFRKMEYKNIGYE